MNSITSLGSFNWQILQKEFLKLYNSQHFEWVFAAIILGAAFLFGRLSQEKKMQNLLNMINDAQSTQKALNAQKRSTQIKIVQIQQKKYLLLSLLFIVMGSLGAYTYIMRNINFTLLINISVVVAALLLIVWLRINYLRWKKKSLQRKLLHSSLTTQNEINQILKEIGEQIAISLRLRFEREIQDQNRSEKSRPCQLKKCFDEKRAYEKLFSLYKGMIDQMSGFNWCEVCANQKNVNVLDLHIKQFSANLAKYGKVIEGLKNLTLQQQKEMINKMLHDWSVVEPNLENICKKGCCIKFRLLLQSLKYENYQKLNNLKSNLKNL